jgi:ankyrin repeat protein
MSDTAAQQRKHLVEICAGGSKDEAERLLAEGAEVEMPDKYGSTPLYAAAEAGHLAVVQLLLQAGADINHANEDGWTPLFIACANGHLGVAEALLRAGADREKPNEGGWTPLHAAADRGRIAVVRMLLLAGADVNKTDNGGWGPLVNAAKSRHPEVVEALLRAGATPHDDATPDLLKMFGKAGLAKLVALSPEAARQAREKHARALAEEFEHARTKPHRWTPEVVQVCWCKSVGLEAHAAAFAGITGKRLCKEVTPEWLAKAGVPDSLARSAYEDIQRLKKLEPSECIIM